MGYIDYCVEATDLAKVLVKKDKTLENRYKTIIRWIEANIMYDIISEIKDPDFINKHPDPVNCFDLKKGNRADLCALAMMMLKSVGINPTMCYGYADDKYTVWVETLIKSKKYRFDKLRKAKKYVIEKTYSG